MSQSYAAALFQNFSGVTRFRDHELMDVAMCRSLLELLGTPALRCAVHMYRVSGAHGSYHFALSAWTDDDRVFSEERDLKEDELSPQLVAAAQLQSMHFAECEAGPRATAYQAWLPVVHDDKTLAVIALERAQPFSHTELSLAGATLGLYGNFISLLQYSETDTLTRLLNRKTFDETLGKLLQGDEPASADQVPPVERRHPVETGENWLAVMDIDHFKQVNDRFGHLFGDEVLILVADEMRRTFRRSDRLFRFGGEEFVVLLRHATEAQAAHVFERFRSSIARRDFPQVGQVTISSGVTGILQDDNSTTLLGRADDALYYAKQHGRDQVRFYETLVCDGAITPRVVEMSVDLF